MVGIQFIVLVGLGYSVWCYKHFKYNNYENVFNLRNTHDSKTTKKMNNVSYRFYPSLDNYEWHTKKVSEVKYPWVARVIHSHTQQNPHMCTAACIDKRIFITAARCIYSLKVKITSVTYQYTSLSVQAFVLPSNPSKQYFEDIGFIVTNKEPLGRSNFSEWPRIKLYDGKRTDDKYQWFADLNTTDIPLRKDAAGKKINDKPHYRVVGYAATKYFHKLKTPYTEYRLSELDIQVGVKMCSQVYALNRTNGFFVPCYLPCSLEEFPFKSSDCKKYHGVEGAGIVDLKSGRLFGIATWGGSFNKYDLPVGFAIPNSDNFFSDYKCAKLIRNDKTELSYGGSYQALCNGYT